jgi:hypothetical protein
MTAVVGDDADHEPARHDEPPVTSRAGPVPRAVVREVSLPLPSPTDGCANARAFVRGVLGAWGIDDETRDDVEQIASELVAHAMRVGGSVLHLTLRLEDVRDGEQVAVDVVSVESSGQGEDDDESPQLFIVGRLSSDWGVDVSESGPRVWALVQVQGPPRT